MTEESFAGSQRERAVYYSEKLRLGPWQISFFLLMTISLGIAYGHAYGVQSGLLVGGIGSLIAVILALGMVPKVIVTESYFQVGKAKLELDYVGEANLLNSELTRISIRNPTSPPGYQLLLPWISESIAVVVLDTEDPHPFWQVSSRQPKALLEALDSARLAIKETHDES